METKSLSTNYGYVTRQDMQYELFPDLPRRTYDNELCREYSVEVRRVNPNDFNSDLVRIRSPEDVYNLLSESRYLDREVFYCLHLNTKNKIIDKELVAMGTVSSFMTTPREVFRKAIISGSSRIIFVHNHPSGDTTPSEEDKIIMVKLRDAGKLLGIPVIDCIIIGDGYFSFKQEELI